MTDQLTLFTEPATFACKACRTGAITVDAPAEGAWVCTDCKSHHSIRVIAKDNKLVLDAHRLDYNGLYGN